MIVGRRVAAALLVAALLPSTVPAGAVVYQGQGKGRPAVVYPGPPALAAAAHYLVTRAGRVAFAVVDSAGHLQGVQLHARFHSASLVKAMLLVAYLQDLARQGRSIDARARALLTPMIHVSDNSAASQVFAAVGESGLSRVARAAGMQDFAPSGAWGFTQISAADQAEFFARQDQLIPRRFDAFARALLSGITASQSWGIPAAARPRFRVFFKGGWLPNYGLVTQAARLERGRLRLSIAVLMDGTPSMGYAEATIEGITRQLLAQPPPR